MPIFVKMYFAVVTLQSADIKQMTALQVDRLTNATLYRAVTLGC